MFALYRCFRQRNKGDKADRRSDRNTNTRRRDYDSLKSVARGDSAADNENKENWNERDNAPRQKQNNKREETQGDRRYHDGKVSDKDTFIRK